MSDDMEELERRIDKLRAEVRRATVGGDRVRARGVRAELREAERRWEESLARLDDEPSAAAGQSAAGQPEAADWAETAGQLAADQLAAPPAGPVWPAREQVHQALTLLGAPAAPRLIVAVHDAFYAGLLAGSRLTSLRRDEERSFRSAPHARPYYVCAALTADRLAPVRGLLAVSTWPMDRRVIGPLSPRVDYLTSAIAVAERLQHGPVAPSDSGDGASTDRGAQRLLWRFATNIPRAVTSFRTMNPGDVASAARAELAVHQDDDSMHRAAAAQRARSQLDDAQQLFGSGLRVGRQAGASA